MPLNAFKHQKIENENDSDCHYVYSLCSFQSRNTVIHVQRAENMQILQN